MSVKAFVFAVSISLIGFGAHAQDQGGVVDTPQDVQSTSEAAT
jgi:hypothetical protein